METETKTATFEEVAAALTAHRAKVATLRQEFEVAVQEQASLKALSESFLVVASTGDKAATAHVEELERRQVGNGRTTEGLQLRLRAAERELQETERDHAALAQKAAADYRGRKAEQVRAEVEKHAHNIMALHRSACRAEYDLCEYLRLNVVFSQELNEAVKAEITGAVRQALRPPNGWNEGWKKSSCDIGRANLTTTNACAPDELKSLEEILR